MALSGPVLDRVVNLPKEIAVFLQEAGPKAAEKFEDESFLFMLCYLTTTFGLLNVLDFSLQGSNTDRIVCFKKVHALMNKLPMWKKQVLLEYMARFKLLDEKVNPALVPWG